MKFIRKNGRVIPIRDNNELPRAAALVGGGIAATALSGTIAGTFHREAADFENKAFNLAKKARDLKSKGAIGPLFERRHAKRVAGIIDEAVHNRLEAKRFFAAGQTVKRGGVAAGATLIGLGVNKALNQTSLEKDPKTRVAISTGAGLTAAFGVRSSYLKRMAGKTVKGADILRHAFKRVGARGIKL